jgi:hypothetical protein
VSNLSTPGWPPGSPSMKSRDSAPNGSTNVGDAQFSLQECL